MSAAQQSTRRPRFALIAVLMFALLALATLSAWLIVQRRSGPHMRGAELVEQMRSEGLSAWWDRSPHSQWFLIRRNGEVIGWDVRLRLPLGDGGFEGLKLRIFRAQERSGGSWEYWQLNADATSGEYLSGDLAFGEGRLVTSTNTSIVQEEGAIQTEQSSQVGPRRSKAEVPENYIPEGTLPLVRRLVAEEGAEAAFRMVFNEQLPQGSRTTFGVVRMNGRSPSEQERAQDAAYAVENVLITLDGSDSGETYLLDEQGRTVGIVAERIRIDAVSAAEVAAEFPEAPDVVRTLAGRFLRSIPESVDPEENPLETLVPVDDAEPASEADPPPDEMSIGAPDDAGD